MKPWTYQALADHYGVCVRTIQRWLKAWKGKVFRPTKRTVRLSDKQREAFEQSRQRAPKVKK